MFLQIVLRYMRSWGKAGTGVHIISPVVLCRDGDGDVTSVYLLKKFLERAGVQKPKVCVQRDCILS